VQGGRTLQVPTHLRDASYQGAKQFGHGEDYKYSHDYEDAIADQVYLSPHPKELMLRNHV
jgi:putative ATPase